MRLASKRTHNRGATVERTRPVGFGLSFVNDADVVGDAYRESMKGRQYQGLSI